MTKSPKIYPDRETRRRRALERFGSEKPICPSCGESDWRCLEEHHLAGRSFDDATVLICSNCHRKITDAQKDHPHVIDGSSVQPSERLGHMLLGIAELLALFVETLRTVAGFLLDLAERASTTEHESGSGEGGHHG